MFVYCRNAQVDHHKHHKKRDRSYSSSDIEDEIRGRYSRRERIEYVRTPSLGRSLTSPPPAAMNAPVHAKSHHRGINDIHNNC